MSVHASFVWGIADVLRGPYKPNQYGNVILPFTILRRLECVMEPHRKVMVQVVQEAADHGYGATWIRSQLRRRTRTEQSPSLSFWNTSAYTLEKALEDPDNLAANLIDYINGFSTEIDVFKNFGFEEQIKALDEYDRLALVTREFAEIDLHPDVVDNAAMGDLFENLIYKFAEASNEQAGDFYTPRDAIRLLVDLVFAEDTEALRSPGVSRTVYDPTAGTGGMLSVAEEHLLGMNPNAALNLYAQEVNKHSYAICKSDLLIKDQDVSNVRRNDTLAMDEFADRGFDFVLSNPPFGQDWKASEKQVRREHEAPNGRFTPGLPAIGDGAMLFLLHVASKMRPADENGRGGRAGIVLNGSPLFNGGAGSGPSEIRGHLLKKDLVEAIVALPTEMFYNTGIATYLWILDNTKQPERRGKVQLIDATGFATKMRKSLGNKRVEISEADRSTILHAYSAMETSDISKVFDNNDFAYWSVTVERPLRLNFACTPERIEEAAEHKQLSKIDGLIDSLGTFGTDLYRNREKFLSDLGLHLGTDGVRLTAAQRKALWQTLGERDEEADVCIDSKGNPEPDTSLRDTEIVPFGWNNHRKEDDAQDETIAAYFEAEVKPHVPDAWIDDSKTKVGYEIPFTRHFYQYVPPRPLSEIDADLDKAVAEILEMLKEIER
ncbi:class I SAM-dependent DNA methyltransferase [Saccharopolyspora sp. NPDC002686]|uniref:type I restriction-modification system subunit M n=1 Tax=Saccharopolyspora sp. NPDC002686 TaxID=3154541 RepID=UPI003327E063